MRTCFDRNIRRYKCIYIKNKDMLSALYCTFAKVLSLESASDCPLTYFRPIQKLSFSGPTRFNKMKHTKITFERSFIAQNPFQPILGLEKKFYNFFLENSKLFYVLTPIMPRCRKVNSTKNHIWALFHSAISFSDHFRTLKNFEKFSKNFGGL